MAIFSQEETKTRVAAKLAARRNGTSPVTIHAPGAGSGFTGTAEEARIRAKLENHAVNGKAQGAEPELEPEKTEPVGRRTGRERG